MDSLDNLLEMARYLEAVDQHLKDLIKQVEGSIQTIKRETDTLVYWRTRALELEKEKGKCTEPTSTRSPSM